MINNTMTLHSQQLAKIEQIVIDQDEKAALLFLTEIYKKCRTSQEGCDPLGMRIKEGLDNVIGKNKAK
jgi:hypothetical protein